MLGQGFDLPDPYSDQDDYSPPPSAAHPYMHGALPPSPGGGGSFPPPPMTANNDTPPEPPTAGDKKGKEKKEKGNVGGPRTPMPGMRMARKNWADFGKEMKRRERDDECDGCENGQDRGWMGNKGMGKGRVVQVSVGKGSMGNGWDKNFMKNMGGMPGMGSMLGMGGMGSMGDMSGTRRTHQRSSLPRRESREDSIKRRIEYAKKQSKNMRGMRGGSESGNQDFDQLMEERMAKVNAIVQCAQQRVQMQQGSNGSYSSSSSVSNNVSSSQSSRSGSSITVNGGPIQGNSYTSPDGSVKIQMVGGTSSSSTGSGQSDLDDFDYLDDLDGDRMEQEIMNEVMKDLEDLENTF